MATSKFPKSRRLRKRREFLRVQNSGSSQRSRHFIVAYAPGSGRVGITVSKRVGGAVTRNRIKRQVREVVRHGTLNPELDIVIIAKKTAANLASALVETDLSPALNDLS